MKRSIPKVNIVNLFHLFRKNENDNFKDFGNRRLLFHGSQINNFFGILHEGFNNLII
jgi:hypothetical protein